MRRDPRPALSTQSRSGQTRSAVTSRLRAAGGAVSGRAPRAGLHPMGPGSSSQKRRSPRPAPGTLRGSGGGRVYPVPSPGVWPAHWLLRSLRHWTETGLRDRAGWATETSCPCVPPARPEPGGSEGLIPGLCPDSAPAPAGVVAPIAARNPAGWGPGRVCPRDERARPQQHRRAGQEGRPRGGASVGGPDWRPLGLSVLCRRLSGASSRDAGPGSCAVTPRLAPREHTRHAEPRPALAWG